ncbi:MAG TPA: helix-turn-helix domain-containing GNAT family N-acetyltransferase [Xanthobacteraceae bacterium]|nr:helix-turn-helix domain-containing GNAT family N-acetyltransferase [Xanthobacteraceae bacterium]
MTKAELGARIAAVRRFNRFYTQRIGVLRDNWHPFSLTEARVLYELTQHDQASASALIEQLGIDAGYLSRILRRFQQQGLIRKETSRSDARRSHLSLTAKGRKAFAPLEARSNEQVGAMLAALAPDAQQRVLAAMRGIERALNGQRDKNYNLRAPRPGDFGWVVARHATFYGENYGWREPFEGMCAQIVADFANNGDPKRERCWIAERDEETVGCIFLVTETDEAARIRLLLVDPSAQGLGIGSALVDACIGFARQAGYRRITLWTHQVLTAARALYQRRGFTLTASKPHNSWGVEVVGETWDLELQA